MSRRNPESGYALLLVYMMAASVAIMLYMELPRVAFEAQREKEQLLIDRGEQYERGIQLYFRKFHQYPATLDALDNTQNIRFLRRRYKDPITGGEWRLIHVGAGGAFIDSVLNKGKSVAPQQQEKQTFVTEIPLLGATSTDQNQAVNLATRRRPSDEPGAAGAPGAPPAPVDPNAPVPNPNNPFNPNNGVGGAALGNGVAGGVIGGAVVGGAVVGQAMQLGANGQPVAPGIPGQPGAVMGPNGQLVMPGANGQLAVPGMNVQPVPMPGANGQVMPMPGMNGQVMPGIAPGTLPQTGVPAQQNPYAQPSMPGQPGAPPPGAVNLINQMLTTPRPGGLNGIPNPVPGQTIYDPNSPAANPGGAIPMPGVNPPGATPPGVAPGASPFGQTPAQGGVGTSVAGTTGQIISGGIAGVASKAEGEGIKVYNDRTKYSEWEFIYDLSKDPVRGGQQMQQGQQMQRQNGLNGINSPLQGISAGPQSPFGTAGGPQSPPATPAPPPSVPSQ